MGNFGFGFMSFEGETSDGNTEGMPASSSDSIESNEDINIDTAESGENTGIGGTESGESTGIDGEEKGEDISSGGEGIDIGGDSDGVSVDFTGGEFSETDVSADFAGDYFIDDMDYGDMGYGGMDYAGDFSSETGSASKPLLARPVFVIGVTCATFVVAVVLGLLLAKRRIKKGIDLYENY